MTEPSWRRTSQNAQSIGRKAGKQIEDITRRKKRQLEEYRIKEKTGRQKKYENCDSK